MSEKVKSGLPFHSYRGKGTGKWFEQCVGMFFYITKNGRNYINTGTVLYIGTGNSIHTNLPDLKLPSTGTESLNKK
jgi:hypothetical protein